MKGEEEEEEEEEEYPIDSISASHSGKSTRVPALI
jgi:hypothetical protein